MNTYKLTLAYDGTNYCGWQIQPNALAVQELLERAVEQVKRERRSIVGAGRTDAGVHALGQVAHLTLDETLDLNLFRRSLNSILPKDIRVLLVEAVSPDFHARYSAVNKLYRYHVTTSEVQSPFHRLYSHHYRRRLDLDLLERAAEKFLGTHNFATFANIGNPGGKQRNPVRTIDRLDLMLETYGFTLEFEGKSFLYKMVRNIVGCLLDVASGKYALQDIDEMIAAEDRRRGNMPAPARGLHLVKIDY